MLNHERVYAIDAPECGLLPAAPTTEELIRRVKAGGQNELIGRCTESRPPPTSNYTGADWRTGWYNRNLRIFSNLLRLRRSSSDRILVIIGAGHVLLLLQMAQTAPEIESIPVLSVLSPK